MRRHCNAISKKAFYDQLFIDTIVIAQRNELSKNISLSYEIFVSVFFKYTTYQFIQLFWSQRLRSTHRKKRNGPLVLPRESFAKINYVAWCKMT